MADNILHIVFFGILLFGTCTQIHAVDPCPENGLVLVPHENDCTKYYICNNGLPIEETCPAGQHFSPHSLVCTDPFTAQCENPLCPPDGLTLVPDPADCKAYYVCNNGVPFPMTCDEGLHFSEELQKCTDPEEAQCKIAICPSEGLHTIPHPTNCTKYYICLEGVPSEEDCPEGLHFSEESGSCMDETAAKCIGKFVCPANELVSVPYPKDCTRYYICNNGDATMMTCNKDLHFSEPDGRCIDINTANCIGQYICPNHGLDTVGDTTNCSRYYVCNEGEAILTDCPVGQHFSQELKRCTDPDIAQCIGRLVCPETGTTNVPYPDDCTKYYHCTNGIAQSTSCPEGDHFSEILKQCTDPETANCMPAASTMPPVETTTLPHVTEPTLPPPYCGPSEEFKAPHPICTKYYHCSQGVVTVENCPDGLFFNPAGLLCTLPEDSGCTGIIP